MKLNFWSIFTIGMQFTSRLASWFTKASRDGVITVEEWSGLAMILADTLADVLGMPFEVKVAPLAGRGDKEVA